MFSQHEYLPYISLQLISLKFVLSICISMIESVPFLQKPNRSLSLYSSLLQLIFISLLSPFPVSQYSVLLRFLLLQVRESEILEIPGSPLSSDLIDETEWEKGGNHRLPNDGWRPLKPARRRCLEMSLSLSEPEVWPWNRASTSWSLRKGGNICCRL